MSIEESIQQIETLIEAWQLDEADLNQTDINAMQVLLKEKQELEKQLEERTKMYQNAYDYSQKMEGKAIILETQQKELKKQLEDKEDYINKLQATKDKLDKWDYENTMQQKEFKKYLEDYQDGASRSLDPYDCGINDCLGDVLSKYKEIIGGNK